MRYICHKTTFSIAIDCETILTCGPMLTIRTSLSGEDIKIESLTSGVAKLNKLARHNLNLLTALINN